MLQPEDPAPKRSKQEAAAQIATLRGHMQGWSAQLHRLQPKCIMDGNLIDHAIVFFIQAVRLRKEMVRLRPHCTASLSVSLRHRLLRANGRERLGRRQDHHCEVFRPCAAPRCARRVQTESGLDYSMTKRSYKELAGACLWLAAKADGSRACLPSRGLMAMGLNVDPVMLAETELVRRLSPPSPLRPLGMVATPTKRRARGRRAECRMSPKRSTSSA